MVYQLVVWFRINVTRFWRKTDPNPSCYISSQKSDRLSSSKITLKCYDHSPKPQADELPVEKSVTVYC
jgi:hypothetical protein